jgi:RNA polymerase sigma-70 factor (ECF subfamily)
MHHTNPFEGLDDYAVNLIRYKTRRLIGQAGYTRSDTEDIEQDLSLHLRQQLPKYNPRKGTLKTFINTVLDNKIRTMVAARTTSQFDFRQHDFSLDETIETETGDRVSRGEAIDSEEYLMVTGRLNRKAFDGVEMRIDVQCAVSLLPADLQTLCARLQERTIVDIAREDGVSRHKIDELRRRIAFLFLEHGLDDCV